MFHHYKKKDENKLKCSNEVDVFQTNVSLLKNIITLNTGEKNSDGTEIIYCFSCSDLSGFDDIDTLRFQMIGVIPGMGKKDRRGIIDKGTISDETLHMLLDLKGKCDEFSDDEFSDDESSKYIPKTASDAIPLLEKLGIYESLKNKDLIVEHTDDFEQKTNVELKVGILQHVEEIGRKFIKKYPEIEEMFPKISDKFGNIHDAAIDYYERLIEYLEYFNLKSDYISIANSNDIDIEPYLFDDGTVLDLSESNFSDSTLARIEYSSLSNLRTLILRDTQISSHIGFDFFELSNLESLDLSYTQLSSIDGGVDFSNLSNLKVLDLTSTQFSSLDGFVFPNLSRLYLRGVPISSIDGVNFSSLSNLEVLDLTKTRISSLTGLDFSSLRELYLSETQISSLEEVDFSSLSNLEVLDLSHTQISSLNGVDFSKLGNLNDLDLSYTQISSLIGFDFWKLRKLKKLQINDISISSFKSISQLSNLKMLYIYGMDSSTYSFKDLHIYNIDL